MNLRDARNILIVGGSFDPPHLAHLIQPRRVAEHLHAEVMLYIPAGRQPLKKEPQTPPHHRLAMLRLMVAGDPSIHISTMEIDRLDDGRPSYTVDTLEQLRQVLGDKPALRLLIGSDQAIAFHRWHKPERILELAEPVVMTRPPLSAPLLCESIAHSQGKEAAQQWVSRIVELPLLDISSTDIRQRLKQRRSLAGLVSAPVEDYIRQHGLYGA